jgi:DNA-binding response OmpR family regulator
MTEGEKRIAVVDDEDDLRDAIVEYMQMNHYVVTGFRRAADFREVAAEQPFDLAILDIAMPGEDGLSLARWMRAKGLPTGIIFATAAVTSLDRVIGLELGADDYVTKPYDLREMLARVRSVLRRLPQEGSAKPETAQQAAPSADTKRIRFGGMTLDLAARTLFDADGRAIDLTATELDVLVAMATRPGRALSRAQILEQSGGADTGDAERAVDIRITRLRKKIEPNQDNPRFVKTVRGIGYMFVGD